MEPPSQDPFKSMTTEEEIRSFEALQKNLRVYYRHFIEDNRREHTVVVIPSLTLHPGELAKIPGVEHYEERLLTQTMVLRYPRTRVIFVTSSAVDPTTIDYYLHLLHGVPASHARKRLLLLDTHDTSPKPLTQKILERPRLLERIRAAIPPPYMGHIACFNCTELERKLALRIGLPLYANDPQLADLGSKSGSRRVFREAGVLLPDGREDLRDTDDLAEAVAELWSAHPDTGKMVVKLNEGFSGEGNAILDYRDLGELPASATARTTRAAEALKHLKFEAAGETWERFGEAFCEMGGIAEMWVRGEGKQSPSVQCRISPDGTPVVISTHDQILGGPSGQIFLGCRFPAASDYRIQVQEAGERVAEVLADHGCLGRFGVDFVVTRDGDRWKAYAIEINLRKGGTTHPYQMLRFLTWGRYDMGHGLFRSMGGRLKYYRATDNLISPRYKGLLPDDLIDISVLNGIHFNPLEEEGVTFHLIGTLSQFGKVGMTCIGNSYERADEIYEQTCRILEGEMRRVLAAPY